MKSPSFIYTYNLVSKIFSWIFLIKFVLAIATFASFAYISNWRFAVLLMLAIGFHEQGHIWAMNKMGISNRGAFSVPFFGAATIPKEQYKSYYQHAFVYLMGPSFGACMALATYLLSAVLHSPILAASAAWIAMLNAFNLIPMVPLDGGQTIKSLLFSVGRKTGFTYISLSLVVLVYSMIHYKIWFLGILILAGAADFTLEILKSNKDIGWGKDIVMQSKMSISQAIWMFAWYVCVSLALFAVIKSTIVIPQIHNKFLYF
jgi:Zn-dependent protease